MGINCDTDILGLFCMCVQWLDRMDYPVIVSRWCAIGEVLQVGILKDNCTCEINILGLFCMCVQWLDRMDYPVIFLDIVPLVKYCRWVLIVILIY